MKIIVGDQWLEDCGMSRFSGIPMDVIKKTNMWPETEAMYRVTLPDGREWCVWSIRGVTEIDDPVAVPEPVEVTPAPVPDTSPSAVRAARSNVRRKTHG